MIRRAINSVISSYLDYRFNEVESVKNECAELQDKVLETFIASMSETDYGRQVGIAEGMSKEDFQKSVPVVKYEDIYPYIQKMMYGEANVLWPGVVNRFSRSSGTSNDVSKYLPVSKQLLNDNIYKASWATTAVVYNLRPDAQIFQSKSLILGGSLDEFDGHKSTKVGDVSAIMIDNMPTIGRPFYAPDFDIATMSDWGSKIDKIVETCLDEDVVMFGGVPTWNIVLFEKILAKTSKQNILEVWPNLKTYLHGGVGFEPYINQFRQYLPTDDFDYIEVYNASEGYFGVQDGPGFGSGMLLLANHGIFFEFIEISDIHLTNPPVVDWSDIEIDKDYAIVISTFAGLCRYLIGDTVRFTSTAPYRVMVSGRVSQYLNVFGEEVMVHNTDQALRKTCDEFEAKVRDYTVAPIFLEGKGKGGHEWIIEFDQSPSSLEDFEIQLDRNLRALNSDYNAKRYEDMALQRLKINLAQAGTFEKWLASKGKLGGQHKVPRLSNSRKHLEQILSYTKVKSTA